MLFFTCSSVANPDYSDRLNDDDCTGLEDVYAEYFDIGTTTGSFLTVVPEPSEILLKDYSSLTGENAFKLPCIHQSKDVWSLRLPT